MKTATENENAEISEKGNRETEESIIKVNEMK